MNPLAGVRVEELGRFFANQPRASTVPFMMNFKDFCFTPPSNARVVAVSALAFVIGLGATVGGRLGNTEAAHDSDDGYGRTIAIEIWRTQSQMVVTERRSDSLERSKPLAERKSDRLPERMGTVHEVLSRVTDKLPAPVPELASEVVLGEPQQLAPWLREAAAVRTSSTVTSGPINLVANGKLTAAIGRPSLGLSGAGGRSTNARGSATAAASRAGGGVAGAAGRAGGGVAGAAGRAAGGLGL